MWLLGNVYMTQYLNDGFRMYMLGLYLGVAEMYRTFITRPPKEKMPISRDEMCEKSEKDRKSK